MRTLSLAGKEIDDSSSAYVIADIGHSHGGCLQHAKIMFRLAMFRSGKEAGAPTAGLQKRNSRALFTKPMFKKEYASRNCSGAAYGERCLPVSGSPFPGRRELPQPGPGTLP